MNEREISEVFFAFGHENVRAVHRATLEFTREKHLSRTGDCILVIGADKSLVDLSNKFKKSLRKPNAKLTITVEADGITDKINAYGSPNLLLTHTSDMVVRKSSHVDSRTLAVGADKAARDLSRVLVEKLKTPKQSAKITLTVHF